MPRAWPAAGESSVPNVQPLAVPRPRGRPPRRRHRLAARQIAALSLRHAAVAPHGAFLVAAGVEGEDHDLGLQMICSLLRARGRRLHCLGANVALPVLIEAVRHYRPAAILLTATRPSRLPAIAAVREAIAAISESVATIPIVVGGQIVADHAATLRAGGILVADLDHVDAIIDRSFATYSDETAST